MRCLRGSPGTRMSSVSADEAAQLDALRYQKRVWMDAHAKLARQYEEALLIAKASTHFIVELVNKYAVDWNQNQEVAKGIVSNMLNKLAKLEGTEQ